MLYLLFQLGTEDRYAIEARHAVEVLPLLPLKRIPQAPPALAGLFDFHGSPVPVLDLSQLVSGLPSQARLSTRIVLVRCSGAQRERLFGVIVEKLTQTVRREAADFSGAQYGPPYLGPVATGPEGLLQLIDVRGLVPLPFIDELPVPAALA